MALKAFRVDNNKIVSNNHSKTNEIINNSARNLTYVPNIGTIGELNFIITNAKKTFNNL